MKHLLHFLYGIYLRSGETVYEEQHIIVIDGPSTRVSIHGTRYDADDLVFHYEYFRKDVLLSGLRNNTGQHLSNPEIRRATERFTDPWYVDSVIVECLKEVDDQTVQEYIDNHRFDKGLFLQEPVTYLTSSDSAHCRE